MFKETPFSDENSRILFVRRRERDRKWQTRKLTFFSVIKIFKWRKESDGNGKKFALFENALKNGCRNWCVLFCVGFHFFSLENIQRDKTTKNHTIWDFSINSENKQKRDGQKIWTPLMDEQPQLKDILINQEKTDKRKTSAAAKGERIQSWKMLVRLVCSCQL